jgi:hypothetical protein
VLKSVKTKRKIHHFSKAKYKGKNNKDVKTKTYIFIAVSDEMGKKATAS